MKLLIYRKTLLFLVCLTFMFTFASTSYAADYDADARYRTGSWITGDLDHGGVRKMGAGVYEIRGYYTTIQLSSWTTFLNGETYIGAFINPSMTEYDRVDILATLDAMDQAPGITYTAYEMIDYIDNAGDWLWVGEITDIRCDGVVEYSYEWNDVPIWGRSNTGTSSGTPTHHDVSYIPYIWEHNYSVGATYPWYQTSPKVQRGGAGTTWTKLRIYYN